MRTWGGVGDAVPYGIARGGVCKRADRVVRPCGRGMRIPTPVFALARNDSASRCRDVGDAVPCEGGTCGAMWASPPAESQGGCVRTGNPL